MPVTAGESRAAAADGARARRGAHLGDALGRRGAFDFIAGRLGLGESWRAPYATFSAASPFPLARQMRAYVFDSGAAGGGGGRGGGGRAGVDGAQPAGAVHRARAPATRARAAARAPGRRRAQLLAQEWDGPADRVSERFRERRGAILLGVQSLWEGVDFPGEALEIVVVAKLPFSVPDDPLVEARGRAAARARPGSVRRRRRARGGVALPAGRRPADPARRRPGRAGGLRSPARDRILPPGVPEALPVPVTVWRDASATGGGRGTVPRRSNWPWRKNRDRDRWRAAHPRPNWRASRAGRVGAVAASRRSSRPRPRRAHGREPRRWSRRRCASIASSTASPPASAS